MQFWWQIYMSKQYGAQRLLSELPDKGWQLGSINTLVKRIRKTGIIIRQPGSGRPRSSIAVEDFVLSREDKPKRHRSAREILHETAILRSSVHRIIHRDLQLKCFKRRRAQLLSEANRISIPSQSLINNLIVCNKYCYCSLINRKLNNK